MEEKDKITLGSGKLYVAEYTGTVPEVATLCVEENRLGYISGGATLEYKPTFYEAKDDLGYVVKTILTEEEAILKSGILTFNGKVLDKLCDSAVVIDESNKRTVKIGGLGNAKNKDYVICFYHEDEKDGDIWVLIVGRNQSGFSLAFLKDKETVIDAEFKAIPHDNNGTLIEYIEEIKTTS